MKQPISNWDGRWASPAFWFATVGGAGLLKPAPGTWGSLVAALLGFSAIMGGISLPIFGIALILVTVLGTIAIDRIENASGIHDAPEIVIDEVAGQWIALLPLYYVGADIVLVVGAFLLFRFFDIVKPWPIGFLDAKVGGGFGVMLDDIVAGLFAMAGIVLLSISL